jgi:hypothetical protein
MYDEAKKSNTRFFDLRPMACEWCNAISELGGKHTVATTLFVAKSASAFLLASTTAWMRTSDIPADPEAVQFHLAGLRVR